MMSGKQKGCFYYSPYLDDYGETDQFLRYVLCGCSCTNKYNDSSCESSCRRGNPLHLSEEQYEQLQRVWVTHAIPQQIARQLESSSAFLGIEWSHW